MGWGMHWEKRREQPNLAFNFFFAVCVLCASIHSHTLILTLTHHIQNEYTELSGCCLCVLSMGRQTNKHKQTKQVEACSLSPNRNKDVDDSYYCASFLLACTLIPFIYSHLSLARSLLLVRWVVQNNNISNNEDEQEGNGIRNINERTKETTKHKQTSNNNNDTY